MKVREVIRMKMNE